MCGGAELLLVLFLTQHKMGWMVSFILWLLHPSGNH